MPVPDSDPARQDVIVSHEGRSLKVSWLTIPFYRRAAAVSRVKIKLDTLVTQSFVDVLLDLRLLRPGVVHGPGDSFPGGKFIAVERRLVGQFHGRGKLRLVLVH